MKRCCTWPCEVIGRIDRIVARYDRAKGWRGELIVNEYGDPHPVSRIKRIIRTGKGTLDIISAPCGNWHSDHRTALDARACPGTHENCIAGSVEHDVREAVVQGLIHRSSASNITIGS